MDVWDWIISYKDHPRYFGFYRDACEVYSRFVKEYKVGEDPFISAVEWLKKERETRVSADILVKGLKYHKVICWEDSVGFDTVLAKEDSRGH